MLKAERLLLHNGLFQAVGIRHIVEYDGPLRGGGLHVDRSVVQQAAEKRHVHVHVAHLLQGGGLAPLGDKDHLFLVHDALVGDQEIVI